MSFSRDPLPDACRAWMPTPQPPPPGPHSAPMVCHMPAGHDGPHAPVRRPSPLDRRWEGDVRPVPRPPSPADRAKDAEPTHEDCEKASSLAGHSAGQIAHAIAAARAEERARWEAAVQGLAEEIEGEAARVSTERHNRTNSSQRRQRGYAAGGRNAAARLRGLTTSSEEGQ
ncbi:MAG: hypothetical protein JWO67_2235 [Streptosporangiaceae bacterium]|nr:hypothetical protein [Streptosporangiaceae bacterium]